MSLQIVKLLVKSCRKESSKFENYTLLQSFSVGTGSGCKEEAKNHHVIS